MGANYGMPYRGSKSRLADAIIDALPPAKHFYDLFGGGGAITHAALLSGKWEVVHYNELNPLIADAFRTVTAPGWEIPREWVSREDFNARKRSDGVTALCWSFNNDMDTYCYAREVEPWKRALWAARVDNDLSLFRAMGVPTDGTSGDIRAHHEEYKQTYVMWYKREVLRLPEAECGYRVNQQLTAKIAEECRAYLREALKASGLTAAAVDRHLGTNGMAWHYFGRSQWGFPTREQYARLAEILPFDKTYDEAGGAYFDRLQSLECLQLECLQSLHRLECLPRLVITCGSYDAVPLERDAVIYCDPPYAGTRGYDSEHEGRNTAFDSKSFFDWACRQSAPVYVSELGADDRFIPVWSKDLACLNTGKGAGQTRKELLMVLRPLSARRRCLGQWEMYYGA